MNRLASTLRFLERDRGSRVLIACAVAIAIFYVFATFDGQFLLGMGPFWANPRGPWLMDANDSIDSIDILTNQVAYLGFLHAPWGLPLFFVPNLGPTGSSVILVDAVPIVALIGKLLFSVTGLVLNLYGLWVGACFVLSALFASLLMIEFGQKSLLAVIGSSLLAISMPMLLYRFGHLSLLGQFIVIGGLWLYARDRHGGFWQRSAWWAGWLCLAALLHAYLFAMAAALYAATWLRRLDGSRWSARTAFGELGIVAACVALLLVIAGHLGKGTGVSLAGVGYGYFSMNLLSPIWPQRSGLFPGFYGLEIGPGGQYEGFNYLGAGVLAMLGVAVALFGRVVLAAMRRHLALLVILFYLAAFAISDAVFAGSHQLIYVPLPHPLAAIAGIFRSSGRMFWPCGYALALLGLALMLRNLKPGWRTTVVLGCCLLQLIDTNPLRARLTRLTERAVPTLIDRGEWEARMAGAERVHVVPSFDCSSRTDAVHAGLADGSDGYIVHLELQRAAMSVQRPIDSVNNPRQDDDCAAQGSAARQGPWDDRALNVFLTGGLSDVPATWRPPGLACTTFDRGFWCLGRADPKG